MSINVYDLLINIFGGYKIVPETQQIIISYFEYISSIINIYNIFIGEKYDTPLNLKIDSYFKHVDFIKNELFGSNKIIFDELITKHKCIMLPIFNINSSYCNEAVIYMPDLVPEKLCNDFDMQWFKNALSIYNLRNVFEATDLFERFVTKNYLFSIDWCDDFVIKNPIYGELINCVAKLITWQIYNSKHPILNLLLNDYVQCGVLEHEDYYLIGFLSRPKFIGTGHRRKITLIVPQKKKFINYKPLSTIVEKYIISAQNQKDHFDYTKHPLHNNNNIINTCSENDIVRKSMCGYHIIQEFRTIIRENNFLCDLYLERSSDIDIMKNSMMRQYYENVKILSPIHNPIRYDIYFYMVSYPIIYQSFI